MQSRLELHSELCKILGTKNVYYQPPESIRMKYPAIVYDMESIENIFSGNTIYLQKCVYRVIVVDGDPDSAIVKRMSMLPRCKYIKHYIADNLNHDVFRIAVDEKTS